MNAPIALRPVAPERVAQAVRRAIADDRPEVLVTALPLRPLLAIQELAPRFAEQIVVATGARRFFERLVQLTDRA